MPSAPALLARLAFIAGGALVTYAIIAGGQIPGPPEAAAQIPQTQFLETSTAGNGPLLPGSAVYTTVRVRNEAAFTVLSTLSADLQDSSPLTKHLRLAAADVPGDCNATAFAGGQLRTVSTPLTDKKLTDPASKPFGTLTIPAGGSATVCVRMTMNEDVPNDVSGATLNVGWNSHATQQI